MTVQLQVGKTYLTEHGKKIEITQTAAQCTWANKHTGKWRIFGNGDIRNRHWMEDGTFCCGSGSNENRIVAEVPGEPRTEASGNSVEMKTFLLTVFVYAKDQVTADKARDELVQAAQDAHDSGELPNGTIEVCGLQELT